MGNAALLNDRNLVRKDICVRFGYPMIVRSLRTVATIAVLVGVVLYALVTVRRDMEVERRYEAAFNETKTGDPLNVVLLRFGEPSDVAGHLNSGDTGRQPPCEGECWLRLWYMAPILGGTSPYSIDFDINQRAIGKYKWASP